MELSMKPQRRPEIAWRVIEGEAVVVDPKQGAVFPLNPVATRLWELAEGSRTVADMIGLLEQEFDAPREILEKDAVAFLNECRANGLFLEYSETEAE